MGEGRGVIFLLCMKDGLLSMAVKQLIFLFCLWGGGRILLVCGGYRDEGWNK